MNAHTKPQVTAPKETTKQVSREKNYYASQWSTQFCRECYVWLPNMDLKLKPKGN